MYYTIIVIIIDISSGLNIPSLNFFLSTEPIKYDKRLNVTPAKSDSLKKSFISINLISLCFA